MPLNKVPVPIGSLKKEGDMFLTTAGWRSTSEQGVVIKDPHFPYIRDREVPEEIKTDSTPYVPPLVPVALAGQPNRKLTRLERMLYALEPDVYTKHRPSVESGVESGSGITPETMSRTVFGPNLYSADPEDEL